MTKVYKLTNEYLITHGNFCWELGVKRYKRKRKDYQICSPHVFHAYKSLGQAIVFHTRHAAFGTKRFRVFEAEAEVVVRTESDKLGCRTLKLTKEVKFPEWFYNKNVKRKVFALSAILILEDVYEKLGWDKPATDKRTKRLCKRVMHLLKLEVLTQKHHPDIDKIHKILQNCHLNYHGIVRTISSIIKTLDTYWYFEHLFSDIDFAYWTNAFQEGNKIKLPELGKNIEYAYELIKEAEEQ